MRLTRHARNKLRLYEWLDRDDLDSLVSPEHQIVTDPRGNRRYRAMCGGHLVTVVVALDNPNLIITIYAD